MWRIIEGEYVKMIVIFNALQTSLAGGIGRYSYELAKELYLNYNNIKIVIREQDLKLFNFVQNEDLIIVKNINNSIDRNLYEQFKLPKLVYNKFPDAIIHYPDSMAPLFAKNKVIITVHDLAFRSLKNVFTWKTILWKNFITKLSIKKADKIIAITNFSKNEILRYYNINPKKIDVVYNGFNDFSKEHIEESKINSEILKLKEKEYILTVSTISPRKNIDGLIKAFNLVKDKTNCDLVVAGKNGWLYENVYNIVDELGIKNRVFFTGEINDDELKFLYKNAKLFVYPSFYEGFGLPPLEAMSFGVPCLISNLSAIPEVAGDAGLYIDPHSIDDMANKLNIETENLRIFLNLKKKGYDRIKGFSWELCAKQVLELYKNIK